MPGLLRGVARTAVIAGTATAVSNNVSRRQQGRWAQQEQQQYDQQQAQLAAQQQQQYAAQQQQYAAQQQQYAAAQAQAAPAPQAAAPQEDLVTKIKELAALKDQGILSEEEFSAAKARLLGT